MNANRALVAVDFKGVNVQLTDLEKKVYEALWQGALDAAGGDFACLEEVRVAGLGRQALGGVVTSLETKGVITVDITYVNQGFNPRTGRQTKGDKVTQVCFPYDVRDQRLRAMRESK